MPIDWSKPVQTKGGRAVRVLCRDAMPLDDYPVVGLVAHSDGSGREVILSWTSDGYVQLHPSQNYEDDLVNVPRKVFVNVYLHNDGGLTAMAHNTPALARDGARSMTNLGKVTLVKTVGVEVS